MADPGLSRWGSTNAKVGQQPIIWPNFCRNCMKIKKIGLGTRPKSYYLDPPPVIVSAYLYSRTIFTPHLIHDNSTFCDRE